MTTINGMLDKKSRSLTITIVKPVCKKCKGELNTIYLLTSGKLYGYNSENNGEASIGFSTEGIELFSCKNEKCKWFGLLTQITTQKTITNKIGGNNGIQRQTKTKRK